VARGVLAVLTSARMQIGRSGCVARARGTELWLMLTSPGWLTAWRSRTANGATARTTASRSANPPLMSWMAVLSHGAAVPRVGRPSAQARPASGPEARVTSLG